MAASQITVQGDTPANPTMCTTTTAQLPNNIENRRHSLLLVHLTVWTQILEAELADQLCSPTWALITSMASGCARHTSTKASALIALALQRLALTTDSICLSKRLGPCSCCKLHHWHTLQAVFSAERQITELGKDCMWAAMKRVARTPLSHLSLCCPQALMSTIRQGM